jgi:hypothetical protein
VLVIMVHVKFAQADTRSTAGPAGLNDTK